MVKRSAGNPHVERLSAFIGEWSIEAAFPGARPTGVRGRTVFEWMRGRQFVVQRWEVPRPDAPDGIAIIGFVEARETYLQHYFDSRGVARVYEMSFSNGVWKLRRNSADFSPLDFSRASRASSVTTARPSQAVGRPPATARAGSTTST